MIVDRFLRECDLYPILKREELQKQALERLAAQKQAEVERNKPVEEEFGPDEIIFYRNGIRIHDPYANQNSKEKKYRYAYQKTAGADRQDDCRRIQASLHEPRRGCPFRLGEF